MNEFFRDVPFTVTRSDDGDDGLTLEGYAAVFDSPTEIDSREGKFTELVARGAFKKSISERTPVLMFNHGQHPLIGDMPLGVIGHIREDDRGLFIRARLANNWLIQPVRDAIAQGAISGMSFRFQPIRDEWSDDMSERTLREVRLPECGPVVFPAYGDTTVGVRSQEVVSALLDDEVRTDVARFLFAVPDISALPVDAVREDTLTLEPPNDDEPAIATRCAPKHRQMFLAWQARQRGIDCDFPTRGAA